MSKLIKANDPRSLADQSAERRFGVGLSVASVAAGGMIALDYLINDTDLVLDPTKPQQDGLWKIEEQLGFGTLSASGRRALTRGEDPVNFDPVPTIIPQDYWGACRLDGLFARTGESHHKQTQQRAGAKTQPLYADVRIDSKQLKAIWKPKAQWRRLWERRILRKPRVGDDLFDPMQTVQSSAPTTPASEHSELSSSGVSTIDKTAEEKRNAAGQADVDFFGSYVRGLEALAVELEGGSQSSSFLLQRQTRCDALYATVKNYLTANRARLGFDRWLRFSSAHPTEVFPKQDGWSEAQYQPWAKANRSARHLRDFLKELGEADGLPAPEALRATHVALLQSAERDRAAKYLTSLTEDEERFLDLFAAAAIPMVPGQTETYLANAVYQAGKRLVASGILTRNTSKDGKERFCLPDATSAAWSSSARPTRPKRECIDIDLGTVWGTGASGSGARGSSR